MVLATDPAKHGENVQKFVDWIATGRAQEDVNTTSEWQLFALETALHAADISNPTLALPLCCHWVGLVFEEFWAQGDLEKSVLGSVSMPMFDRDKIDLPTSQISFMRFVTIGLYQPLCQLIPEMGHVSEQMHRNLLFWEDRKKQGLCAVPTREEWFMPERLLEEK